MPSIALLVTLARTIGLSLLFCIHSFYKEQFHSSAPPPQSPLAHWWPQSEADSVRGVATGHAAASHHWPRSGLWRHQGRGLAEGGIGLGLANFVALPLLYLSHRYQNGQSVVHLALNGSSPLEEVAVRSTALLVD